MSARSCHTPNSTCSEWWQVHAPTSSSRSYSPLTRQKTTLLFLIIWRDLWQNSNIPHITYHSKPPHTQHTPIIPYTHLAHTSHKHQQTHTHHTFHSQTHPLFASLLLAPFYCDGAAKRWPLTWPLSRRLPSCKQESREWPSGWCQWWAPLGWRQWARQVLQLPQWGWRCRWRQTEVTRGGQNTFSVQCSKSEHSELNDRFWRIKHTKLVTSWLTFTPHPVYTLHTYKTC